MKRFKIKVCGITRPKDAERIAQFGGDMIGMIFYRKSPRAITLAHASEIVAVLPPVIDRVGVFVDEDVDRMLRYAARLRLDYIQLHGRESEKVISKLRKAGLKVIKAFNVRIREDYRKLFRSTADLVMLDAMSKEMPGGSGDRFDWSIRPAKKIPNLILAGGLSAANVQQGVSRFDPVAIDVNSGVESSPGIKSRKRLIEFFQRCNSIRYGR